jgi:hypothetical protein
MNEEGLRQGTDSKGEAQMIPVGSEFQEPLKNVEVLPVSKESNRRDMH